MIQAIHISDTHIGPTADFEFHDVNTAQRLERLVAAINGLDFTPDLVIHTGDVTNDPSPEAYQVAAGIFSQLSAPAYFVTGNHDDGAMIRTYLEAGPSAALVEDPDRVARRIDLPDLQLFLLDAKVPEKLGPHGAVPENQLAALESALAESPSPFAVFVHFPALPIQSPWIDQHLPLENGETLHQLLVAGGTARNRGVFFGHLHRGLQIYRDGVLYSGVSSPAFEFTAGPEDETIDWNAGCPIPFNHITFSDRGTSVKEHVLLP